MRISRFAPLVAAFAVACNLDHRPLPQAPLTRVGRAADGTQETPVNQTLRPHGTLVDLPGMRPQAVLLSRDGMEHGIEDSAATGIDDQCSNSFWPFAFGFCDRSGC
jgi:hypothetical protein